MLSRSPSLYTSRGNPWDASSPAVTSSESPGSKNPKNDQVSTKMIAVSPTYPAHWMSAGKSRRRPIRSDRNSIASRNRGSEPVEVLVYRDDGQRQPHAHVREVRPCFAANIA